MSYGPKAVAGRRLFQTANRDEIGTEAFCAEYKYAFEEVESENHGCLFSEGTDDQVSAILFWMSRAFVKEDVDLPERSGRKRSTSGLPPGASNYITARGAKRLRDELQKFRGANAGSERINELERILASVHVVDPPEAPVNTVTFGATVTVKDKNGTIETFTIVGVDELDFEQDAVSWISPVGKALLNADMGDWITLEDGRSAKIVKIQA